MSKTNKRIYLSSPHMGGHEIDYIKQAFNENWVAPLGPNVDNFEKDLASYLGVKHAAALSSGTAAIHLALIMLGVKPGDYVIAQSFTFSATVNPIVYCRATPVLVDSEEGSWNMDPVLLEKAIIDCIEGTGHRAQGAGQKTADSPLQGSLSRLSGSRGGGLNGVQGTGHRAQGTGQNDPELSTFAGAPVDRRALSSEQKLPSAILPVHLYGMPSNMSEIMRIADKYGIPVIEDAAEALGSEYMGRKCGSFGKMGVLSFNGNKIITTSGGGALVSDDEELIQKARFLATQARDKAPHYQHSQIGYNYRMSNIVAGIGRGQMEVIDERVRVRRENFEFYKSNLSGIKGVSFIDEPGPEYFSNRWLTTILIDPEKAGTDRERVRQELEKQNIETRPLWKPMHLQPIFQNFPAFVTGVSERLFDKGLCLPSGSNMTEEDRERVMGHLLRILKRGS